jgi:hypothetical protein
MTPVAEAFNQRLDSVTPRLEAAALASVPDDALTAPDPPTGERWEAGQVWAHLAEFIPYWIGEAQLVLSGARGEPPAFGRTKKDAGRIAAIERERGTDRAALWARVAEDVWSLHAFILGVPESGWTTVGRHPTLGEMSVERLVEEFLVGHIEEHADQLEDLAGSPAG